jgi:hypothetical protein
VSLLQAADIPRLVACDAPYFGAERAAVFASLLADLPQRVFVTRNDTGQITGYLFAKKQSIGPWVADTIAEAEQLLAHALSLPFEENILTVNTPVSNNDANKLLTHYGFTVQRTLRHMRRGQPVPRNLTAIYGLASFALG